MANCEIGRRQFLLTAAGAAVLSRLVSASAPLYNPGAKFTISVSEVDVRKNAAIMQGALDDNVLPSMQEKFVAAYRAERTTE
jgi:hypothetical protein